MFILISLYLFVVSRNFHLAHTSHGIGVGSWVAVEPNGTQLSSTATSLGLEHSSHRLGCFWKERWNKHL